MQVAFIDYEHFDGHVAAIATPEQYHTYKHLLPEVALYARGRFMETMQFCKDIFTSASFVKNGMNLPDTNYNRYLQFMCSRETKK